MKYISLFLLFSFLAYSGNSQSITVTQNPDHTGFNTTTFPTKNGTVSFLNGSIQFAEEQMFDPASWAISHQKSKLSFLMRREALLLNSFDDRGVRLIEKELEFFDPADNTLQVYQFNDGRTVVRDNVASFTFFDAKGEQVYVISNTSQSMDGERESQLSSDKAGRTIVLYNPVIAYGSGTGSRARMVFGENHFETLFNSTEREIKSLNVSDDGVYVAMIVTTGSSDEILIFDRFGNQIFRLEPDDQVRGVSLTKNATHLTTFAGNRMQVYEILSGERIGSASSQATIVYAEYVPEDDIILGLGGSLSNTGVIASPTVTAVHIGRRQIAREQVDLPLSQLHAGSIGFTRNSSGTYSVNGMNREIEIRVRF
ncbi:MAG: hypothetical protein EA391_12040 [Balneolaceae bacterium]|nr:MAG: hypothetical protein EA391_12040 [Balneolaceae bacterium]